MEQDKLTFERYSSPIGEILAFYQDQVLCHLDFTDCRVRWEKLLKRRYGEQRFQETEVEADLSERLDRYFAKDPKAFDGLQFNTGGTDFQQQVWKALCDIPFGGKETYSSMAKIIGKPSAVRAMAAANALNPISIIVPCHRIIGKDGSLTGYGGGLERKKALLKHEQR